MTIDIIKKLAHKSNMTATDSTLLCLAACGGNGVKISEVRLAAISAGIKGAKKTNFSSILSRANKKSILTPNGWELTELGWEHLAKISSLSLQKSAVAEQSKSLRDMLLKLKDADAREFLSEAITCSENNLFRAAVVLSWVGAVALLQNEVVISHLAAFNVEASRRNPKWKAAKSTDDLGLLKESEFLDILQALGIIGKNVKQELGDCLRLRNSCGHPNSLKISENKVAAHLETLTLNVFSRYV